MQLTYQKFDLPLRHVFTISRGSTAVQETLIVAARGRRPVRLRRSDDQFVLRRDDREHDGGDRSRCGRWSKRDSLRRPAATDRRDRRSASQRDVCEIRAQRRSTRRFTICGASCAAPRCTSCGVCRPTRVPQSDYTLGIDTPEKMVAKLNEMPGWPIYKIKLGTADDLGIVRELRRHTDAVFRVDANCGWTADQTIELAPALKKLGRRVHRAAAAAGGSSTVRGGRSNARRCRSSPTRAASPRTTSTAAPAGFTASTSSW